MARRKSSRRDPAPAEILHLCAQIRRGWNELTYRMRAGYGQNHEAISRRAAWSPPLILSSDLELPREMARPS